jgi:hypothetical protein
MARMLGDVNEVQNFFILELAKEAYYYFRPLVTMFIISLN